MELTVSLARKAAQDAANKQMRKQGRVAWNKDDWRLACKVYADLIRGIDD